MPCYLQTTCMVLHEDARDTGEDQAYKGTFSGRIYFVSPLLIEMESNSYSLEARMARDILK